MTSDGVGDNVVDMETELEIKALRDEIQKLKNNLNQYKILLNEVDEDAKPDMISDEEVICVQEIAKLKKTSNQRPLTSDEVKNLDILHKNLKLARGENTRVGAKGSVKKKTAENLEKIITGK